MKISNLWRAARARFSLRCSERGADHCGVDSLAYSDDGGALAPRTRSELSGIDSKLRSLLSRRLDLESYGP